VADPENEKGSISTSNLRTKQRHRPHDGCFNLSLWLK